MTGIAIITIIKKSDKSLLSFGQQTIYRHPCDAVFQNCLTADEIFKNSSARI